MTNARVKTQTYNSGQIDATTMSFVGGTGGAAHIQSASMRFPGSGSATVSGTRWTSQLLLAAAQTMALTGGTIVMRPRTGARAGLIDVVAGGQLSVSTTLGGANGLEKTGPGELVLATAPTLTGTLALTGGALTTTYVGSRAQAATLATGTVFTTKNTGITAGADLVFNGGTYVRDASTTGYDTLAGVITVNSGGGTLQLDNADGTATMFADHGILGAGTLHIYAGAARTANISTGQRQHLCVRSMTNANQFTGTISVHGTAALAVCSDSLGKAAVVLEPAAILSTVNWASSGYGTVDSLTGGFCNANSGMRIGANNSSFVCDTSFADVTGSNNNNQLQKMGTGTVTLSNATNRFSNGNGLIVTKGVLRQASATVLNPAAPTASGGPMGTGATTVSIANDATASLSANGFTLDLGSISGGGTAGGTLALGAVSSSIGNDNATKTFSGTISGTNGLLKRGTGTQTLTGTNTVTGGVTMDGGGLYLDFSAAGAPTSNILAPQTLVFNPTNSSTLTIKGKSTTNGTVQSFTQVSANRGASTITMIQNGATAADLYLGPLVLNHGTLTVTGSTGVSAGARVITTSVAGASDGTTRLGGSLFGTGSMSITNSGGVNYLAPWAGSYTGVTTDAGVIPQSAGADVAITEAGGTGAVTTASAALTQVNSLTMQAVTTAAVVQLDAARTLSVGSAGFVGGDIVLSATGAVKGLTIGNTAGVGSLTYGSTASDVGAIQLNNLQGSTAILTVNANIVDNAGAAPTGWSVVGGMVYLAGTNTNTGECFVLSGTTARVFSAGALGATAGSQPLTIQVGATLSFSGSWTAANNRTIVGADGGTVTLDMNSGANTLQNQFNHPRGQLNVIGGGTTRLSGAGSSFYAIVGPINNGWGTLELNFPAGANIPCKYLVSCTGSGSNSASMISIKFIGNDNQLDPTCQFSAASNRAYNYTSSILLNGTNQICGGWGSAYVGGTRYAGGNKGVLGNGHATIASTVTLRVPTGQTVTSQSGGYRAVRNVGAAALNVIKDGGGTQSFATDEEVSFTGTLAVVEGQLTTPTPGSTAWSVTIPGAAPVVGPGCGRLALSTASPNLNGKTLDILCTPTAAFSAFSVLTWPSGTATTTTFVAKVNGTSRTLGTPFALGAYTVTLVNTGTAITIQSV